MDSSSKLTNQTLEIAMQFLMQTLNPTLWLKILPQLQALINNVKPSTTERTPNEVAYGFTPNTALDLLKPSAPLDFFTLFGKGYH